MRKVMALTELSVLVLSSLDFLHAAGLGIARAARLATHVDTRHANEFRAVRILNRMDLADIEQTRLPLLEAKDSNGLDVTVTLFRCRPDNPIRVTDRLSVDGPGSAVIVRW